MPINCPKCGEELGPVANSIKEETITVTIQFSGDLLESSVVTELLKAVEKSVKETARCLGTKAAVFVTRLDLKANEFSADLFVSCKDGVAAEVVEVFHDTVAKLEAGGEL